MRKLRLYSTVLARGDASASAAANSLAERARTFAADDLKIDCGFAPNYHCQTNADL